MASLRFTISPDLKGLRLDQAIAKIVQGDLSRRKIRQIIDVGGCYVNGKRTRVVSRLVQSGDRIDLEVRDAQQAPIAAVGDYQFLQKDILFQKAGLIAVNKPSGLPSQATRQQAIVHVIPVLEQALKAADIPYRELHLLHRLDRDTCGVMLLAMDRKAAEFVGRQFQEHQVDKVYHAIIVGLPDQNEWTTDAPLSSIHKETGRVSVSASGRSAMTSFKVIERFEKSGLSLVACYPKTGRSHQIRVHLEHSGCPILGDRIYGRDKQKVVRDLFPERLQFQLLHAFSLAFKPSPRLEKVIVEAPYSDFFAGILQKLRSSEMPSL